MLRKDVKQIKELVWKIINSIVTAFPLGMKIEYFGPVPRLTKHTKYVLGMMIYRRPFRHCSRSDFYGMPLFTVNRWRRIMIHSFRFQSSRSTSSSSISRKSSWWAKNSRWKWRLHCQFEAWPDCLPTAIKDVRRPPNRPLQTSTNRCNHKVPFRVGRIFKKILEYKKKWALNFERT